MCGIFGMLGSFTYNEINEKLNEMSKILKHRGPDDEGFHIEKNKGIGIGMTRLSIVDRKCGHQPIYNEDKSLVIVFNGEIYNYKELRDELILKGHIFTTKSDTETILHLFEEEGPDSVKRLNGMFAIAILNRKTGELFLARDRFGIKMLEYSTYNGFIFASEIKAFLAFDNFPMEIDEQSISDYFSLWYVPVPNCALKSVKKLTQGHWMIVKSPDDIIIKRFWYPDVYNEKEWSNEEELKKEYFNRLEKAVLSQLQGEVPIGVFLSGGLDSGSIVAMLAKNNIKNYHSFSVGFDHPSYDESPLIKLTSKKFSTNHHHIIVKGEDVIPIVQQVTYQQDEPLAFPSYPYYILCKEASKYVTVVLGGDGGDETLGGYDTYFGHGYLQFYRKFPNFFRKWFKDKFLPIFPHSFTKRGLDIQIRKFVEAAEFSPERAHVSWREIFNVSEKYELLNIGKLIDFDPYHAFKPFIEEKIIKNIINRFMYADMAVFLPEVSLMLSDRIGMAHSLEVRVPFLDNYMADFSMSLPINWKVRHRIPKYISRKFLKGVLPDEVIKAPKLGFTPPIAQWVFGPLKNYFIELLNQQVIKESSIINTDFALKILNEHLEKKKDHSRKLMVLFGFSNWYIYFYIKGKEFVRNKLILEKEKKFKIN